MYEKLLVHLAAAQLTQAAMPQTASLPLDPGLVNDATKQLIGQACETHRVFYHWLCKSLNHKDWPDPAAVPGAVSGPLATALNSLVKLIPGPASVVGAVPDLAAILAPTAAPRTT